MKGEICWAGYKGRVLRNVLVEQEERGGLFVEDGECGRVLVEEGKCEMSEMAYLWRKVSP